MVVLAEVYRRSALGDAPHPDSRPHPAGSVTLPDCRVSARWLGRAGCDGSLSLSWRRSTPGGPGRCARGGTSVGRCGRCHRRPRGVSAVRSRPTARKEWDDGRRPEGRRFYGVGAMDADEPPESSRCSRVEVSSIGSSRPIPTRLAPASAAPSSGSRQRRCWSKPSSGSRRSRTPTTPTGQRRRRRPVPRLSGPRDSGRSPNRDRHRPCSALALGEPVGVSDGYLHRTPQSRPDALDGGVELVAIRLAEHEHVDVLDRAPTLRSQVSGGPRPKYERGRDPRDLA